MNKKFLILFIFLTGIIFIAGCVDKFDLTEFSEHGDGANITGDTVYIPLNPVWEGFNSPQDIIIGKEPFIYIADTGNDRIVMMNLNGEILGTKSIKNPIAIAQDYELNLFVVADFDTLVGGQTITYSAVYKLEMVPVEHQIAQTTAERLLPRTSKDFSKVNRVFTGMATFYDNSVIVSTQGPNNATIGEQPDNSIWRLFFFRFGARDTMIVERIPNIDPLSSGLVSANEVSSLTTFNNTSIDFILTLTGNNSFKVQHLTYVITPFGEDYESKYSPSQGVDIAIPNKLTRPEGSAVDAVGNVYIADAAKDSVFKFNAFGDELQSFGGPDIFNEPYAVAFFDKTLYVADTGNNRILRFILSTDL